MSLNNVGLGLVIPIWQVSRLRGEKLHPLPLLEKPAIGRVFSPHAPRARVLALTTTCSSTWAMVLSLSPMLI
jgi:hypothetical protein